ncbi:MAG: hypothetical protein HY332_11110 [Chloroflexi bacterium]|nr:hypothetical protein [Chloroflexota bacterium]
MVQAILRVAARSNVLAAGAAALAVAVAGGAAHARQWSFAESSTVVVTEDTLERHRWTPSVPWPSTGAITITGRLRNDGNAAADLVRVVVTLADSSGTVIRTTTGYPIEWRLAPGEEVTFFAPTFPDPRIASHTLRVEQARRSRR